MRQIVLDTETTGLEVGLGHRVIEVAAVEISNRRVTEKRFHRYLNPEREIDSGALDVHGISTEFLRDKPRFAAVADEFIEFITGAELIIHNAPFDVGFLDQELALAGHPPLAQLCGAVTDTLRMAKELHPGKRNNLDALCERYQVDNARRSLHGALLDAELLAEVYLAMTRGQDSLMIDLADTAGPAGVAAPLAERLALPVVRAVADELAAHEAQLKAIDKASGGRCLWLAAAVKPD
ncbi:MAG TPA: DNA polymerase III subunit epsilon [Pelomicrobium sp.]|nr:DNA polymerase III subunit epsilon [Pelomicrobium sp.]